VICICRLSIAKGLTRQANEPFFDVAFAFVLFVLLAEVFFVTLFVAVALMELALTIAVGLRCTFFHIKAGMPLLPATFS
jgi:hypothetical protein